MAPRQRMTSTMLWMPWRLGSRILNSMLRRLLLVSGISLGPGFGGFIHFCGLSICGLLDFLSLSCLFSDFCGILFLIYFLIDFGLVEIFGLCLILLI